MLAADGSLVDDPSAHSLYTLELQGGLVALRDVDGKYLTDRESAVKTFKIDRPGHDELFALEPSPALVSLRTFSSGRYVCCRPGKQGCWCCPCGHCWGLGLCTRLLLIQAEQVCLAPPGVGSSCERA